MGSEDSIKRLSYLGKQPAPSRHVRGVRIRERIAGKCLSRCFDHPPGFRELSNEHGIPTTLDLGATCGELETPRQVIEVLGGANLAPLVALVLQIEAERPSQFFDRQRGVRCPSSQSAIEFDLDKHTSKVKQQSLSCFDGHTECLARPNVRGNRRPTVGEARCWTSGSPRG